ncbi:MAG: Tfp pilus assembly protein pilus retraction ATPase PilT [Cyanobacteriota bacterium]|jgi:twitching motility protein PilT
MEPTIEELMRQLVLHGGSDLHLAAGDPAHGRFNGELTPMGSAPLSEKDCSRMILSLLSNEQRRQLEETLELDLSYGIADVGRFRINIYRQRGSYAACIRALGNAIPSLESLHLSARVASVCELPKGLVLVTGPTGSGKSTTLAALINHINQHRSKHIITIEDPIEYLYKSERSLIHQRQVPDDSHSFSNAIRASLREDPDVILVGELRDLETIQLAITAAETGHLVFATLHTSSAAQTVDRMVDVFPSNQQPQIRVQLSGNLAAIFAQTLCRRRNPGSGALGRVVAQEILFNTPAIANMIREGKTAQIQSQIQTSGQLGMQTMDKALADLVQQGVISLEEAQARSSRPDELARLLSDTP